MTTTQPDSIELTRPVLLEFAMAVYLCQCFESSLCLLLALMDQDQSGEEGKFSASWDFHSTKTLGQLLQQLRKRIDVPYELDEYLADGIRYRNELIHGYLIKNALCLAKPKGRIEIEAELVALKREVKKRDIAINELIDKFLAKYGLSNDILKRNADRYWKHENSGEGDDSTNTSH